MAAASTSDASSVDGLMKMMARKNTFEAAVRSLTDLVSRSYAQAGKNEKAKVSQVISTTDPSDFQPTGRTSLLRRCCCADDDRSRPHIDPVEDAVQQSCILVGRVGTLPGS